MKLGLIAYADDTGLGTQTQLYYEYLQPAKTMLLDREGNRTMHEFYPERYPAVWRTVRGVPTFDDVNDFLEGLDVVLMAETSPTQYLLRRAKQLGVKTVVVPNWEYYHDLQQPQNPRPDLLMPASLWHFDEYPEPKVYMPMPVRVHKTVDSVENTATNFVHVAGDPIMPDRNGSLTVLKCLEKITASVNVTIFCRNLPYIDDLIAQNGIKVPKNVQLLLRPSVKTTAELYENQHVMLMPRRFGGLCLPVNEAISYGLPVLMPDISPNNQWLPKSWLVPAKKIDERMLSTTVDIYDADVDELASLISRLRNGRAMYWRYKQQVAGMQKEYAWPKLVPKYLETLSGMV